VDERLRELDFGIAEGRTLAELRDADPQMVARFESDPVAHYFPGGEDPRAAVKRMREALSEVQADAASRVLLVTHNTLLRLVLCDCLGIPLERYRRVLPGADHCAITEIAANGGGLALCRYNAPTYDE
jgi:probable phosphoglycerate mutase